MIRASSAWPFFTVDDLLDTRAVFRIETSEGETFPAAWRDPSRGSAHTPSKRIGCARRDAHRDVAALFGEQTDVGLLGEEGRGQPLPLRKIADEPKPDQGERQGQAGDDGHSHGRLPAP